MSAERTEAMADMYRQGLTLSKIGEQYGVTRERIRQILRKVGVTRADGGKSVTTSHKAAALTRTKALAIAHREAKWGCDIDLLNELRANGTVRAFEQQRWSASTRGIAFKLTFAEWYAIWQTSGKLHLRGRGKAGYCMSRIKDSGGYELGNVRVQTCVANSQEAVAKWKGKTKPIKGVYCLYPGREMAWLARVGKQRLGFYATAELADDARNAWLAEHPMETPRALGQGKGWTFVKRCPARPYQMQCYGFKKQCFATQAEAEAAYAACVAQKLAGSHEIDYVR